MNLYLLVNIIYHIIDFSQLNILKKLKENAQCSLFKVTGSVFIFYFLILLFLGLKVYL